MTSRIDNKKLIIDKVIEIFNSILQFLNKICLKRNDYRNWFDTYK